MLGIRSFSFPFATVWPQEFTGILQVSPHLWFRQLNMIKPVSWQVSKGAEWLACDHRIHNWYWNIYVLTLAVSPPTSNPFLSQDTYLQNLVLQRGSFPRAGFRLVSSLMKGKSPLSVAFEIMQCQAHYYGDGETNTTLESYFVGFPMLLTLGLSLF